MSEKSSKNSNEAYKNVEARKILEHTENCRFISRNISTKKVTITNRSSNMSSETNSRKSPKSNENGNEKQSNIVKPKKTVRSMSNICKQFVKPPLQCNKCGKVKKTTTNSDEQKGDQNRRERNDDLCCGKDTLLHCYKNDRFNYTSDSVQRVESSLNESTLPHIGKHPRTDKVKLGTNLDTIYSGSSEVQSAGTEDIDDERILVKLIEFREKNYFECHSVSNIKGRVRPTTPGHECSYRFYLNDRLFPVPICTDYNNTVRCTGCYLPMNNGRVDSESERNFNGTIQAKVALGDNTNQDLTIILPVNETMIISERRKKKKCNLDDENFYFGVIRLSNQKCNSLNKNWPSDSLALRYQKGYREPPQFEPYRYKKNENSECINI